MGDFIELDSLTRVKHGSTASGEIIKCIRKEAGGALVIFVDSGFSGAKAHLIASTVVAMATNLIAQGETSQNVAESILNTFGEGVYAFTLANILSNGEVEIVEYKTSNFIFFRNGLFEDLAYKKIDIINDSYKNYELRLTRFTIQPQDRIIIVSKGVISSGQSNNKVGDKGWDRGNIINMLSELLKENPQISAHRIALGIVSRANMNDEFVSQNDLSCGSIYFRTPRRILISTGPPFEEKNDKRLARKVDEWDGTKIISGGTTSQIIARELGKSINVSLGKDVSGLPPTASMEGIDLITEGVLTLAKVKEILDKAENTEIVGKGIDYNLARMLLSHDVIRFLVGTRINTVHQDPDLPFELELRRTVVKELSGILMTKFLKEVKVEYI